MTTVSSSTLRRGRRLRVSALLASGALAFALSACAQRVNPYEQTGALPDDPKVNHPITLQEEVAALDVPVSVDTLHLTKPVMSNIDFFAKSFIASGTAIIAVVAPSGSPNQLAAAAMAVEVEHTLLGSGVDPRAISYRVYRADPAEKVAPVRIAYNRITAHTEPCGAWNDQSSSNADNKHYDSFGCATQQNLAAVLDNPLDLLYPRGLSPADAARRAHVLEMYRKGQAFSSDNSQLTGGTVATGVGQ
jgi:pilus assembly protein CpaD